MGVVEEGAFELAGWGGVVGDDGVAVAVWGGPVGAVGAAAQFVEADVFGAVVSRPGIDGGSELTRGWSHASAEEVSE